ncbi:pectinesterase family protein [Chengkuizengella axinellae]|uniref:Pectinesterase family protein n=1 Tax=Chengkuizengella axinellae TaxID=3064388 RepID=A0ABT9J253_9BACL|nr:pectinesterase family protein [Chengkuizengella sp. 2205SS18-9]MDP5275084.1 pectinesterase family protein [Chengkuizengella sp. 2205SS18-9]
MAVFNLTPASDIQDVINNFVNSGDTINLGEGTYNQSIDISMNKNCIRIVGAGIGKTILDGSNLGTVNGIEINSFMVTVEKLTVQNFDDRGIFIQTSENIINQIKSQNNQNNGVEINLNAERNLVIESEASFNANSVNPDDGNGIQVEGNQNYIIKCKFIKNSNNGINLNSINNLVLLNLAKENGLHGFDNDNQFSLFMCNQSIRNEEDGFLTGVSDLFLWNKAFLNGDDGIETSGSNNLFWGNEIRCNQEDGIDDDDNNNRIVRNKIERNIEFGIVASSSNIIDRNDVKNNGIAGICIEDSAVNNSVRSNQLNGNNPDIEDGGINTVFDNNQCSTSEPPGLCNINTSVSVPGDFLTIQEAIDDPTTTEGFTIRIGAGRFYESITIPANKDRIRLIGAGKGETIIDGTNVVGATGIHIQSSSFITIEKMTVQNFDNFGICINTSDNILSCVNVNNNLNNGIDITSSCERNIVIDCESSDHRENFAQGIQIRGNHNYIIRCNCSRNIDDGIEVRGEFNLVLNSICKQNDVGIDANSSNHYFVSNVTAENICSGLEVDGAQVLLLWNQSCENVEAGIEVFAGNNELLWGNNCKNNGGNGINLSNEGNNRIVKNILKGNTEGIEVSINEELNIIDNNTIANNIEAGIMLLGDENKVRSNCLTKNTPDIVDQGTDNALDENKCTTSIPDGFCEDC